MAIDEDVLQHLQTEVFDENPQYSKSSFEKIVRLSDLGYRTFGISKNTKPTYVVILKEAFQKLEDKGVIAKILKNIPIWI